MIIERYRATNVALDYYAATASSTPCATSLAMVARLLARARVSRSGSSVAAAIAMELLVAWSIRDNLTLTCS